MINKKINHIKNLKNCLLAIYLNKNTKQIKILWPPLSNSIQIRQRDNTCTEFKNNQLKIKLKIRERG
jgi:hypothetical protein